MDTCLQCNTQNLNANCIWSSLLRYDAIQNILTQWRTALFWVITQRALVITCRRFGTTYRSQLQASILTHWSLKMRPTGYPETSARNCQCSLRNDPEERSSHLLRSGSLSTRTLMQLKVHHSAVTYCLLQSNCLPLLPGISPWQWFPPLPSYRRWRRVVLP